MTVDTVPERIVDKNGRYTTIYRRPAKTTIVNRLLGKKPAPSARPDLFVETTEKGDVIFSQYHLEGSLASGGTVTIYLKDQPVMSAKYEDGVLIPTDLATHTRFRGVNIDRLQNIAEGKYGIDAADFIRSLNEANSLYLPSFEDEEVREAFVRNPLFHPLPKELRGTYPSDHN